MQVIDQDQVFYAVLGALVSHPASRSTHEIVEDAWDITKGVMEHPDTVEQRKRAIESKATTLGIDPCTGRPLHAVRLIGPDADGNGLRAG